jgi:type II secretory pathway pseudopilin PulG
MIVTDVHESTRRAESGLPLRILEAGSRFPRRSRHRFRGGFTIIELLVVVAVVIALVGLLIVGVNIATRASQKARTQFLMNSIKQGLIRFREDVGYYPPVLGPNAGGLRDLFVPPAPLNATSGLPEQDAVQEWFSTCAIADYLIGYSHHHEDGYGRKPGTPDPLGWTSETPPAGIRHPGDDGVWGATLASPQGLLADRMQYGAGASSSTSPRPWDQGKVLGPYLELKDERLLAGINYEDGQLQVFFPGDPLPPTLSWDTIPRAIVDYWGMPIRYYRKPYPPGSIAQSYRPNSDINRDGVINELDRVPTLSDVYVLRPWDIKSDSAVDGLFGDDSGSAQTTRELETGEFALLSFGPDKQVDETTSNDSSHDGDGDGRLAENEDNIVEVGP